MATTYTVKKGDTLWDISKTYANSIAGSNTSAKVQTLVKLNDITDPDYIVVGQVLKLSGTATTAKNTTSSRATIKAFGLQSNTDRTVYATWTWTRSNTDEYQVKWHYATGDGIWFIGDDSTVKEKQSTYNAPSNATKVKFQVKPISKKRKVNNKEVAYWTASWSTAKTYNFSDNPPGVPDVPDVTIDKYTLTARLENLNVNATGIQFQVVRNNTSVFKTGTATIKTSAATFSCTVNAGNEYKVRCRAYRGSVYSDWTDYSENIATMPSTPDGITTIKAMSETSVYLEWPAVKTATTYDIEYATEKRYLETGSNQTSTVTAIETTSYEIGGLESGKEYFFRVRGIGSNNEKSAWSGIASIIIGKAPAAPTTWSSTTTVITGDDLTLYWVHNAEDGSKLTLAEIELYIDDIKYSKTIENLVEDDGEEEETYSYVVDTSEYVEGTQIQWRVKTAGITQVYGDWSVQRTVDVYAPPTLELNVVNSNNINIDILDSFPFYISGLAGPNTQAPIGYHVTISSNEIYETVDSIGNMKVVNTGEAVYSKYFDTNDPLLIELSASNIMLENNISYTVTCVVSMNSGLTAESSSIFSVAWTENEYEPNAEIGIDEDTYTATIRPYCEDENGVLIEGILLSVYRREFDGTFTEIAVNLRNEDNIYITDPHPALDYARYRIVSKTENTGTISYYDMPGYPVGGKSVIIQWSEDWSTFDVSEESELEQPTWSGSMLKLPYNIDVSDKHKTDVALIEYIGRSYPVSYHGTQKGFTSTWSMSIPKKDEETLYGIRRLANWMGNVYLREPSGSGYWASIQVSYSQKHLDLVIPITLDITRVEGGT